MKTLYVLAKFKRNGNFIGYVVNGKGRGKVSTFDDPTSARRALGQRNRNKFADMTYKVIKLEFNLDEVEVLDSI